MATCGTKQVNLAANGPKLVGVGSVIIESDPPPCNTRFRTRILRTNWIPNTLTGQLCELECGHVVLTFGSLEHANGVLTCLDCRNTQELNYEACIRFARQAEAYRGMDAAIKWYAAALHSILTDHPDAPERARVEKRLAELRAVLEDRRW